MSSHQRNMVLEHPMSLEGGDSREVRTQFGALCYRYKKKKIEVLLITSRTSKRWIVPKGWPVDGKSPSESAAIEAWEEAGVLGETDGRCVGVFSYSKDTEDLGDVSCLAMVFAIEVRELAKSYPESAERDRVWVSRKKAAKMVEERELSRLLRDFDPRSGN